MWKKIIIEQPKSNGVYKVRGIINPNTYHEQSGIEFEALWEDGSFVSKFGKGVSDSIIECFWVFPIRKNRGKIDKKDFLSYLEKIKGDGFYRVNIIEKLQTHLLEEKVDMMVDMIFFNEPIHICKQMMQLILEYNLIKK